MMRISRTRVWILQTKVIPRPRYTGVLFRRYVRVPESIRTFNWTPRIITIGTSLTVSTFINYMLFRRHWVTRPVYDIDKWFEKIIKEERKDPLTIEEFEDRVAHLKAYYRLNIYSVVQPRNVELHFLDQSLRLLDNWLRRTENNREAIDICALCLQTLYCGNNIQAEGTPMKFAIHQANPLLCAALLKAGAALTQGDINDFTFEIAGNIELCHRRMKKRSLHDKLYFKNLSAELAKTICVINDVPWTANGIIHLKYGTIKTSSGNVKVTLNRRI